MRHQGRPHLFLIIIHVQQQAPRLYQEIIMNFSRIMWPLHATMLIACLAPLELYATEKKADRTLSPSAQDHYLNALLHKYHLAPNEKPFSYRFTHEVYSPLLGRSHQLPREFINIAVQQNSYLQNTTFFRDTKLLQKGDLVRSYQLAAAPNKKESGALVSAVTDDGHVVEGTLLNRNSSTLIVIGPGFTNYRELMAPMGDLFNTYDVLFFDYRGHGYKKSSLLKPSSWKSMFEHVMGIDRKKVRLGQCEEKDVYAIVSHVCRHKKYNAVVGLGVCYSGLIFIKTAAIYPQLFTKLVLDGCWFSLQHAVDILSKDPGMIARPQYHSKWQHNILVRQRWFQKAIVWLGQKLFNVEFNTVSVLDYAPLLREDMPIFFIHGKNDLLIPRDQFEILYHATNCRQKTVLLTSNEHVRNHLKEKELYKEVIELFVNLPYEQFNHLLINPEALADYKTAVLHRLAASGR
jgi:pimeloyl-ACP methyl ester carboxylesterase